MTCAECKYCKRLYVPVLLCFDHARNVRDRYVCTALDDCVMYLGDDSGQCEVFSEKGMTEITIGRDDGT